MGKTEEEILFLFVKLNFSLRYKNKNKNLNLKNIKPLKIISQKRKNLYSKKRVTIIIR